MGPTRSNPTCCAQALQPEVAIKLYALRASARDRQTPMRRSRGAGGMHLQAIAVGRALRAKKQTAYAYMHDAVRLCAPTHAPGHLRCA